MACCKLLFHVHTRASFDSLMSPRRVIRHCERHGIGFVVICDHDSMASIRAAVSEGRRRGVTVIPAVEYGTDAGDIIGLFIETMTSSRKVEVVLNHIRSERGLTVLPHPLRGHDLQRIPTAMIDFVEVYNARCPAQENEWAVDFAARHDKPALVGADAHFPSELGLATNHLNLPEATSPDLGDPEQMKRLLRYAPRSFTCGRAPQSAIRLSQIIKGVRQQRPDLIWQNLCRVTREAIRRRLWRFNLEQ